VRTSVTDFFVVDNFQVGDWVRFWDGNAIKIGQVQYVLKEAFAAKLITDAGTATARDVLERRGS